MKKSSRRRKALPSREPDPADYSEEKWRKKLTDEQFRVLREQGTEPAFSGKYHDHKEQGAYVCAGCGHPLFHAEDKFDSKSGWPSFSAPIAQKNIESAEERRLLSTRTEVHCARCKGHLGHVFDDGPPPTGKRYCINSISLHFKRH